jgi:hypothetical protein
MTSVGIQDVFLLDKCQYKYGLKRNMRLSGILNWSGRQDLNLRPPHPQCGALPDCATPRKGRQLY